MSEGSRREDTFRKTAWKEADAEFVPFGEKVLAKQVSTDPVDGMNPRYRFGIWLGMRNNSAECFIGNADGVFRADWTKSHQQCDLSSLENDRQWTDQKFEKTRFLVLHCYSKVHGFRGKESPSKTLRHS